MSTVRNKIGGDKSAFMRFKTNIVILFILLFGFYNRSSGQTITFNILKQFVASRDSKDSILKSFKFKMVVHLPPIYGTESQQYISPDSSRSIEFLYRESATSCVFWTKDLDVLQNIISAGRTEGFTKTTVATASPKITAYVKGKYLLEFTDLSKDKKSSNVILTSNYQAFNVQLTSN
jgi:hypothetical protein